VDGVTTNFAATQAAMSWQREQRWFNQKAEGRYYACSARIENEGEETRSAGS
jgi:hypothetical protein